MLNIFGIFNTYVVWTVFINFHLSHIDFMFMEKIIICPQGCLRPVEENRDVLELFESTILNYNF